MAKLCISTSDCMTELQWWKNGYIVKKDAMGIIGWNNCLYNYECIRYPKSEVKKNLKRATELLKAHNHEVYLRRKARKQEEMEIERDDWKRYFEHLERLEKEEEKRRQINIDIIYLNQDNIGMITECENENPNNVIVLDCETTGLDSVEDEILQLSIINTNNEVLFNEYVNPIHHTSWKEAEGIHGISPSMVENCRTLEEFREEVQSILDNCHVIIAYNGYFDIGFLKEAGFVIDNSKTKVVDIMLQFAQIYGEWSEYYNDYKWKKLSVCANYYDYEFKAHDSLEDTKATLHCYKQMIKMKEV